MQQKDDFDIISEEDSIEDLFDYSDVLKTEASEERKTENAKTTNRLAYLLVICWLIILFLSFFNIFQISDNPNFERLESVVLIIIGFYFGKRYV